MLFAVPLKPFDAAKGRLSGVLDATDRRDLAMRTATHVVRTCHTAHGTVAVVTADPEVASWAMAEGCAVIADPGGGLDAAAAAAVAEADGGRWCIVHGDLPLVSPNDIARVVDGAGTGAAVLAPSIDGGTNLFAAAEPIAFAYGRSSFTRHLRATAHLDRKVVVTSGTVLDIDNPTDLARAATLAAGAWLREFADKATYSHDS